MTTEEFMALAEAFADYLATLKPYASGEEPLLSAFRAGWLAQKARAS